MLIYNFRKVIRMKAIVKPYGYLVRNGIPGTAATKMLHNKVKTLSPRIIEKFCIALGCVPHDFMEWTPDAPEQKTLPLKALIPDREVVAGLGGLIKNLPPSKVRELVKFAEELAK